MMAYSIQQPLRAHNVIKGEVAGVRKGVLDVRAGCKVHHTIDIVLGEQSRHLGLIIQVAFVEREVRKHFQAPNIGKRGDFVELVEADDFVFGIADCQMPGYPASAVDGSATSDSAPRYRLT